MKPGMKTAQRKIFRAALDGIGNDLVNELVRVAPVDTGFLRNSMYHEVDGDTLIIRMPQYAFYIEFGTRPHEIRAINAKALHFKGDGGEDVFAKVIHHPGTEPNPFIRRTLNTKLRDIVINNIKGVADRYSRGIEI